MLNLEKYENVVEDEFTDPVLRCDSCNKLVKRATLHKIGACGKCGNKRVRNINVLSKKEHKKILAWGFADFAALFEETDDE